MNFIRLFQVFLLSHTWSPNGLCNTPLLNKFLLSGQKYSIYQSMLLCGHVKDKCCTLVDEIKIQKMWLHQTEPFLTSYYDQVVLNLERIIISFDVIAQLDPRLMNLKYLQSSSIPYFHEFCAEEYVEFGSNEILKFDSLLEKFKYD